MSSAAIASLADYVGILDDTPLGHVRRTSARTLEPFLQASHQAAENLLDKAERDLARGDLDRARTWVERAVRLPFDHHEEWQPAAMAVHMRLFCLVTDEAEMADPEDSAWLEAAVEVLSTADDEGRLELRHVLRVTDQDWELSRSEHARIREVISSVADGPELDERTLDAPELAEVVLSILGVCREYAAAMTRLLG